MHPLLREQQHLLLPAVSLRAEKKLPRWNPVFGIIRQSTVSAENIDADTASVALHIYNFDETDLSGGIYMRSTAGTQIHAGDLDDTYISVRASLLR